MLGIRVITIRGLELRIYIELDISGWAANSANTEYKNDERTAVTTFTKLCTYLCIYTYSHKVDIHLCTRVPYMHNKMCSV